jgi:hypothetical protein
MNKIGGLFCIYSAIFSVDIFCCCAFLSCKSTNKGNKKRIESMVAKLTAGEIVMHLRNSTQDYEEKHGIFQDDVAHLKRCIRERLENDPALKGNVGALTIQGNDRLRRASLGPQAKVVHEKIKKDRILGKNRLPSSIAANGLPSEEDMLKDSEKTKERDLIDSSKIE